MSRFLRRLLTQSFPGNREVAPDQDAAVDDGEDRVLDSYESQAFAIWWEAFQAPGGRRLLDLGTIRPGSLAFFAARGMEIGVCGIDPDDPEATLDRRDDNARWDGALCWDLPNYIAEEQLASFGAWLAQQLTPGAPVFLALATRAPFPDEPAAYEVVDERHLRCRSAPTTGGRTALLSGPRLGRIWTGFAVARSFLLRNGMQEYVLERQSEA